MRPEKKTTSTGLTTEGTFQQFLQLENGQTHLHRHIKNDIKDDKKIQQGNSRNQHLKPSTSTKKKKKTAFTTCQDNQTHTFKWPTT